MPDNNCDKAMLDAVRHALEIYAKSYDTMTRIAQREDRLPVVSPVSVAFDIRKNMVSAVVDALSKLRAEGVQAGDERAAFEEWHEQHYGKPPLRQINSDKYVGEHQERWAIWQARAALASAPVADTLPLEKALYELVDKIDSGLDTGDLVQDARRASTLLGVIMASAPVAGEAQPSPERFKPPFSNCSFRMCDLPGQCRGEGKCHHPATQASEAVRIQFPAHLRKMWSGGEVQTWLDEHQGITPPKASAKGSLERYRKWQAEQTRADKDGGDCAKGAGDVELLALMERAAREAGGSQWVAEGFESRTAGAAFYGGLIMNADGETVVAQCVNESNASHMMSSSPANVLWIIRQYRAALAAQKQGDSDA